MTKTILMALIAGSILSGVLIFALTGAARAAALSIEAAHRSKGRLPMRQRFHKIGLVLLISMLCLLPGEPQAFKWTFNGHQVVSVSSSGANKFLKTTAAVAGFGLVASAAGPGALLVGGGIFFGAQSITRGINDAVGQAYADTKDLENHAADLAKNLEQNAAYIIQEGILQANDIIKERTAELSELSNARIFDAQVAALNAAATVESGFERVFILFLGCLVAAIVAAAALLRARGAVPLWRSGLEAALVGALVVVFAFPLLPRALALTGLKNPEQQFDTELANHKKLFEKAMLALKFDDAVTEALALQAYDPQNHNYVADYKKAKLLRTLFVSPLRLPDAAEAADALRQVTDIADSQDEPDSTQASITIAAQPSSATEEVPDPDLLTVIAYVTAATAKDRATDAFAGITASTALDSKETRPGTLTSLAGLILQNFCTIPPPSPTTIAATSKLQHSLSPDFVPTQTPEPTDANLCVNVIPLKNPESGKKDIFTSLRTSSTSNDVLFQQTSVAFTTFLHRWFECMLPAANSSSCLPNSALNRDSTKSVQMVGALLTDLQEKVIKPWKEGFNTSVVNNGNAALGNSLLPN